MTPGPSEARATGARLADGGAGLPPATLPAYLNAVYQVARKELLQHLRTKRLLIIGSLLLATLILITLVVPLSFLDLEELRDLGNVTGGVSLANFIMLLFLVGFLFLSGYFLLTLLPIVLTADAVCSEWSQRTIFLLLSKPVSRTAFVLGKFLGSSFTVAATLVVLLTLDYVVLLFVVPGGADLGSVGRFFGALGILVLGVSAWAAVSLFFSSITRSTVLSMILTLTSWIIVFPILGNLDRIIAITRFGTRTFTMSDAEAGIGWSQYLSPGSSMSSASNVLLPTSADIDVPTFLGGAPDISVGGAVAALIIQTLVFLALSLWIVQRRNFE